MNNEELYKQIVEEGVRNVSDISIASKSLNNFSQVRKRLEECKFIDEVYFKENEENLECYFKYKEDPHKIVFFFDDIDGLDKYVDELFSDKKLVNAVRECEQLLTSLMYFTDKKCLRDYIVQLRILKFLSDDIVIYQDNSANKILDAQFINYIVDNNLFVSLDTMYTIHAVYDNKGKKFWLHTHGLNRCNSIEIEMFVADRNNILIYQNIISAIANTLIEKGGTILKEALNIGYSNNQNLRYYWKPWEEYISKFPANSLGGQEDRLGAHDNPSGIFLPFVDNKFKKYDYYKKLFNHIILFFSDEETERMSINAQNTFLDFFKIAESLKNKEIEYQFMLKVKLDSSYVPKKEGAPNQPEHVWIEVENIDLDKKVLTGKLLNDPYYFNVSDSLEYPFSFITDVRIETEEDFITPMSIYNYIKNI